MSIRSWRLWLVVAAVLIVPTLITGGVYVSFKYADTNRFNRCLGAIPSANLSDPGVTLILDDLKGTGRYEGASWNINKPYRPDAYNILVPSGEVTMWPEACEVPQGVPDCMASPKNRFIICNPEMGHEFESRLLHSGAASIESDAAMRFVLLTFVGHELGHIEKGRSSRARHLLSDFREGGLSCVHHPKGEPSEEEQADEFGTKLACQAIVRRLANEQLPNDPAESLKLVSSLQDELDDSYFLRDDACVGDVDYPSIGRRKHTFSLAYLKCIYPSEWNPVEVLAEDDAKSFDHLEKWLESRQRSGQIASGSYGRDSLYAHTVTALPRAESYLTFDSTGTASDLWLIQPWRDEAIRPESLDSWKSVGRVLNSQPAGDGRIFWIWLAHDAQSENGVLMNLDVSCVAGLQACGHPKIVRKFSIPYNFLAFGGDDGSVAVVSTDFVARPEPGSGSQLTNRVPHGLKLDSSDDAVVAVTRNETLVLSRNGQGVHDLSVVRGRSVQRRLLMMPASKAKETLEAAAVEGDRLLLSSNVEPITGDSSLFLWDCPAAIIDRSATSPRDDCVRYQAPTDIEHAVALATRDLSFMFDLSIRFPRDCGDIVAVQHRGWVWVIDKSKGVQDLLPADGIVHCDLQAGQITTFRARRIDKLALSMQPVKEDKQSILSVSVNH